MKGFAMLWNLKRKSYGAVVLLTVFGAVAAGSAQSASTPTKSRTAAGSYTFISQFTARPNGGAAITELKYKGGVTGIAVDTGTEINHSNGSFAGSGTELCASCTVGGKKGAFIAHYVFSGSGATYSGTETFTRGFGGLAGLGGGGRFKGNNNTNTYSYSYHR
jgi:hypothetical protein